MKKLLMGGLFFMAECACIALIGILTGSSGSGGNHSKHHSTPYPRDHAKVNAKIYGPTGTSTGYGRISY